MYIPAKLQGMKLITCKHYGEPAGAFCKGKKKIPIDWEPYSAFVAVTSVWYYSSRRCSMYLFTIYLHQYKLLEHRDYE